LEKTSQVLPRDPTGPSCAKTPLEANCKALPLAGSTESSMGRLQLANLKASKKVNPAKQLEVVQDGDDI